VIGNAISEAAFAVLVIVTYHDLRVAQEGVDTEEIAAVFE
jgi:branched-subunit amino acid transport protein AzlD